MVSGSVWGERDVKGSCFPSEGSVKLCLRVAARSVCLANSVIGPPLRVGARKRFALSVIPGVWLRRGKTRRCDPAVGGSPPAPSGVPSVFRIPRAAIGQRGAVYIYIYRSGTPARPHRLYNRRGKKKKRMFDYRLWIRNSI